MSKKWVLADMDGSKCLLREIEGGWDLIDFLQKREDA